MSEPNTFKAVALDLDGTLAGTDHLVSDYASTVLAALEKKAVRPLIITGRTERSALAVARAAGISSPVISTGGGVVTRPDTGERLVNAVLDPEFFQRFMLLGEEAGLQPFLMSASRLWTDRPGHWTDLGSAMNQQESDVIERSAWPTDVVKAMLVGEQPTVDALQERLDDEFPTVKRSTPYFLEANLDGYTKWGSLQITLAQLDIRPEETMGFGDGDTDIEWLSNVGLSVAVDNATKGVQDISRVQIGHHRDDAVADFLNDYFDLNVGKKN